jgi:hypothetical protein
MDDDDEDMVDDARGADAGGACTGLESDPQPPTNARHSDATAAAAAAVDAAPWK